MKIDGGERVGRRRQALRPSSDQLRHQLPLGAAGVLELVDQHVVISRLEPIAALRELVHLPQQLDARARGRRRNRAARARRACAGTGRSAIANIRQTPRDMTTFRSRRNPRIDLGDRRRHRRRALAVALPGVVDAQSSALKPVPAKLARAARRPA